MGGTPDLILPVKGYTGISSWITHQHRNPRSTEPGTDFYVPIGTPIMAPADGYIYGHGETIGPATGFWVGINFDNGLSYRSMHHSKNLITSGRVKQGDIYALSGATGYGEWDWSHDPMTGGAHVHATLWPTHDHRYGYQSNGRPFTIDLMPVARPAAGSAAVKLYESEEDEDMPDSMFAVVDGVPSWCWLNWATGTLYAVHTQAEADWVGAYMGSVKMNLSQRSYNGAPVTDGGSALYKSKLALFGILCPDVKVKGSSLTPTDLARIQVMLRAGTAATVA